jgi:hypothetical protein
VHSVKLKHERGTDRNLILKKLTSQRDYVDQGVWQIITQVVQTIDEIHFESRQQGEGLLQIAHVEAHVIISNQQRNQLRNENTYFLSF